MTTKNFLSKIRGLFSASQSTDVSLDCRLTVGSPSFHRRSTMLKLVSVLVLILTLGVGQMWAVDPTLTITRSSFSSTPTSYSTVTWSQNTSAGTSISGTSTTCFTNGNTDFQMKNGHPGVSNTTALPGAIKSVTMTRSSNGSNRSVTLYASTIAITSSNYSDATKVTNLGSKSVTTSGVTWSLSAAQISAGYKYFYLVGSSNALFVASIVVTYSEASCSSEITITKGSNPANGTFTINNSGTVCIDEGNASTTVTATPSTHYHLATVTSTGGGSVGAISNNTCTVSNISANTTINVTFAADPTYTVTWVAGSNPSFSTQTNYAGTALTDPGEPSPASYCPGGKVFVGWTATPIVGEGAEPADLFTSVSGMSIPVGGTTYYAVFATQGGSGSVTKSDELTYTSFYAACTPSGSNTSGSYTDFSNKSGSESDAVYAGKLYKHGNGSSNCKDYIQMRTSNSDSGIITTTSGGKAKKVTVDWNSGTANAKVVNIYGKSTAYSAASDLYNNSTSGDLLGTITKGTSTELTITEDYEYIGIRSSDGAIYFDAISIDWQASGGYTYSNYATTCCTPLGTINGSVSWSNAATAVVSWDDLAHVSSWTVKYKTHAAVDWSTAGASSASAGTRSVTISSLTPCTNYDFKIIATPDDGYCDKDQTIEDSQTHNWTVTSTGVTHATASPAIPGTTCASGFSTTITPATGYALPADITVTNATKSWTQGTGALTISSVTGNVTITITPTCVSPVVTADPDDADYYIGDDPEELSVTATLASGTRTYLWKVSTNGGSTWSDAAGTNNLSTYSGASLSTASAGTTKFKCIVGNSQGGCTVESGVATITVTAASYFVNGETVFIQADSKDYSAWKDDACVKAWFNNNWSGGSAETTYWLFDATDTDAGKKLFATVVPASGDLNIVQLQRFAGNCSDKWNDNGSVNKASSNGVNTFRSYGSADNNVAWNGSSTILYLYGSQNSWGSSLGTFADQGAGVWTATISNYTPDATSKDYKIKTSYNNGWIGNTGSNDNATLSDMIVGSTYNVTATLNVTTHALTMSKTFVKGEVSFDLQGHGSAISKLTNVAAGSKISAPSPAPTATGYTFGGWYKEPACTNAWNFASDVVNETMTLYAKWTINSHTLTWNWGGGSTSSTTYTLYPATSGSVNYNAAITKPANGTMSKTGYNFSSWSSNATTMPDEDLTITAQWTAKTTSITLNKNNEDASGSTAGSASWTYDQTTKNSLTAATRTGYNVDGYYTAASSGTKILNADGSLAGNSITVDAVVYTSGGKWAYDGTSLTLYAHWTLKTTTVSFNQNSGTGGQTTTKTATYSQAMPTPITTPTRAGYTFTGYFENSGGTGTKYYNADGSSATNWNKENATWTLYAGWTAKEDTYKTALHTGESGWTSYASGVTKSGAGYTIPNPGSVAKGATSTCEDTHYHFAGWVTDANKEAGTISGNIIAATGTTDATGTTYWAVWEKETSGGATTIELNYSNLSVSTSSYAQSSATVGGVGFTINQGYRGGSNPNYLIQMNSSKGDGTLFNTTAISGLQSIKLYCATAGATATIYQGTSQKPVSTSDPDERIGTAACAASTNYTINFTGSGEYFTLKVGGATYFSKIEVSYCTYEDPKAECEACVATPTISGVSLSGSSVSLTSVPVQATGASAGSNCAIASYGFCWGTSANPTGNSTASANLSAGTFSATLTGPFSVGQTYYYRAFATNEAPNTGYSSDGTFTLRSVTFDLNGHGSSAPSTQYVLNGGKASDPGYSESVTNWRFVGWYDEAACRDGHEWVFGTNTVSGGNATIYAKWLPDPTVSFSVPTGVDAVASQRASVNLPTPTGFPSAVDDDCWAFAGWTESSSVNGTSKPATFYPAGTPYTGSQTSAFTLYAVYSRNKYLVVYDNDMLVANADYVITTWESDNYAIVGVADGVNAEVADMDDNFHDKVLRGLHYYTLDNPAENAVWHLTGTTGSYVLQNKATGKYMDVAGSSLISESSATLAITEGTGEDNQTYKVTGGDNHLVIASSGASVATGDATYYFLYKLISSKYMTSPSEPTYTVTWKVAGEDDQTTTVNACEGLTAAQISALTIPDDDHLEVKNSGCITNTKGKFMGWSTRELGSTSGQGDPGDLFKTYDKAPYLTDDITLYAVFAEAGGGGVPYYGLVEEDENATEGTYLIVYNGTYAMGSHHDGNNTDTYSDYSDISSYYDGENKRIASNGTTNALAYIAEKTTNGYSLKHSETISSVATDVYLGCSKNDNKALRWDYPFTASTDEWVLGAGSINSVGQSSRYIRWNNTSGQYRFSTYVSASCQDIQLYKYNSGVTYSNYRTNCCDKTVTIGTPTKTGSGAVTFASGGNSYAAGDEVGTCEGGATITATVTPTNGYQCTVLSFMRSDEAALTPDPAISVPFTGAQSYDLTFEQNADGVTLNTTVTFVALIDHYIDNMHYNTTQNKSGNYGTAPTLSDESKGEQCTGLHYKFIGWIPETDMNMTTGVPTTTANMVAGGATGKYATGTNYYAIWAEEE